VQIEGCALQAVCEHALPGGRMPAAAFAEHLGVVDFTNLDVATAHGRPDARDAALATNGVRSAAEQQQETAPGVGVAARLDRQLADQVTMEQRRELGDCR